jgi:hypothetical protein
MVTNSVSVLCYNALCQFQIELLPRQRNHSEMRLLSGYGICVHNRCLLSRDRYNEETRSS